MAKKQIIIDYEEYLDLVKCKNLCDSLAFNLEYCNEITNDNLNPDRIIIQTKMPESFKNMFGKYLFYNQTSKLILVNKNEEEYK